MVIPIDDDEEMDDAEEAGNCILVVARGKVVVRRGVVVMGGDRVVVGRGPVVMGGDSVVVAMRDLVSVIGGVLKLGGGVNSTIGKVEVRAGSSPFV